jgi:hypothetical protein
MGSVDLLGEMVELVDIEDQMGLVERVNGVELVDQGDLVVYGVELVDQEEVACMAVPLEPYP